MSNDICDKKVLQGFPLSRRERLALDQFCGEVAKPPKGVGKLTLGNLLQRRWIKYQGIDERYNPAYLTISEGVCAIQLDDIALARGLERPLPTTSMSRRVCYEHLDDRLRGLLNPPIRS